MTARVDHGLTEADLAEVAVGTVLHFTNHPCRSSVPVTYAGPRGRVVIVDDSAPVAYNADGSAVCRHRDLSVCPGCRAANGAYVVVHGATYHVPDPAERAELVALLTGDE
jgi:hypothetical protein